MREKTHRTTNTTQMTVANHTQPKLYTAVDNNNDDDSDDDTQNKVYNVDKVNYTAREDDNSDIDTQNVNYNNTII